MHNSAAPGAAEYRWSSSLALVLAGWVGCAGAVTWCTVGPSDAAGRLLIGVAAGALGAAALFGSRARPRLAADTDGMRVRGLTGSTRYPWAAVRAVDVVHTRRWGRTVPTLRIEARDHDGDGEHLFVFGRLDLGADPRDVADTLAALRAI